MWLEKTKAEKSVVCLSTSCRTLRRLWAYVYTRSCARTHAHTHTIYIYVCVCVCVCTVYKLGHKPWDERRILFCSQHGSRHAYGTEHIVHVFTRKDAFHHFCSVVWTLVSMSIVTATINICHANWHLTVHNSVKSCWIANDPTKL